MSDRDQAAYDELADEYSRVLDPDGVGLIDPVLTELVGDVTGRDVLSLACGQGQDARLLTRLGATVTGVDVSTEMLRYAGRHEAANPRGIAYVQGDAQDLAAFGDRSFDGVVCHMALMDIPAVLRRLVPSRACSVMQAGSSSRSSTRATADTSRS